MRRSLEALENGRFDLLVIGGGIVGARVAYEAAHSGLTVALVDAGDFAGGTSSASSKLLHGGFRYLARFHFGLVQQAQHERELLATRIAPHLVWPRPLVVSLEADRWHDRWKLVAGIGVYGALSGFRSPHPRLLTPSEAGALVPGMRNEAVGALGPIQEMQTHDGRLTLATIEGACAAGAVATSYARVVEIGRGEALVEDALSGGTVRVSFRAAVNATGPWVDSVRRLERPSARPIVRLSKGTQATFALPDGWLAGLAVFDERRSAFAVPWQGMLLVGATDDPYTGSPGAARPTPDEVEALRAPLAPFLPESVLAPERLLHSWSGVRALPLGSGTTGDAPREHVIDVSPSGLVSVAGGKLTTHRLIAMEALRRLPAAVRPRRRAPSRALLPGGGEPGLLPDVDAATAAHLFSLYGSRAADVVASAGGDPDRLAPIHPLGPDIWAQALYAVEHEGAVTADDVLLRRTTVAFRGLDTPSVRAAFHRRVGLTATRPPALV
jgi:glycerol-3-phosphate dehydrogenase